MGQLEDKLKSIIRARYGGVPKFAKEVGIPAASIYTVLRNGINGGSVNTVIPILAKLGIDSNWIVKNQLIEVGKDTAEFVDIPLYGAIAAGTPIEMLEIDGVHPVPRAICEMYPGGFLLRVEGNSMNRILPNGCFAYIEPCDTIDADGQPYAICVNGYDATIKRVHKLNNGFELMPDSTDTTYKTEVFNYNEPGTDQITVIGRVVYHVLPFDWSY